MNMKTALIPALVLSALALQACGNGEAQRREVATGYRTNGSIEIVEGVAAGEQVVVTGQASLRDKTKVQVIE